MVEALLERLAPLPPSATSQCGVPRDGQLSERTFLKLRFMASLLTILSKEYEA